MKLHRTDHFVPRVAELMIALCGIALLAATLGGLVHDARRPQPVVLVTYGDADADVSPRPPG